MDCSCDMGRPKLGAKRGIARNPGRAQPRRGKNFARFAKNFLSRCPAPASFAAVQPQSRKRLSDPIGEAFSFCRQISGKALEGAAALCHRPRVKLTRVLPLLLALALLLPGCGYNGYTKFRSSNLRGEMLAEWTARGFYYRTSTGYRITAIERVSGPPYPHESYYPHGWKTSVTGPVIEKWKTERPSWLDDETFVQEHTEHVVYEK